MLVQPDEVGDPVGMGVARNHNVVADIVGVEGLESTIAISLVSIPGVIVERVYVSIGDGLVDPGEDSLRSYHTPRGFGVDELRVEPVFLTRTHHC